jgi:hypothetical protein
MLVKATPISGIAAAFELDRARRTGACNRALLASAGWCSQFI